MVYELQKAVKKRKVSKVLRELLEKDGKDVNQDSPTGTPLRIACDYGRTDAATVLLRHNPNLNAGNKLQGRIPLFNGPARRDTWKLFACWCKPVELMWN